MSIVDFVCLEKRIVVEVDGGQHQKEKDRDKDIEDNEVLKNIKGVLEIIRESSL
ncbi:MAG: DUF559 domain-containing protein [Actinomycetota bacterium]|nr:DUF559 domain-containing protein [Actinomycetota bacterium]